MHLIERAARVGCLAACLLAVNACNAPDAPVAADPQTRQDGNGAEILLSEGFADAGTITIVKDAQGNIGFGVEARIGSDAQERLEGLPPNLSLAEVYQSLRGGEGTVPAIVAEASGKLESRPPAGPDAPSGPAARPLSPSEPAAAALAKSASYNAFATGYCRDFRDGAIVWRHQTCYWRSSDNAITAPDVYSDGWLVDRVYTWNASAYTATVQLWNWDNSRQASDWWPKVSPYTVTWFQFPGTYSAANAWMLLPANKRGELGMVVLSPYPDPH